MRIFTSMWQEPMTIKRSKAYETWRACAEAIHSIVPDMAVSLLDLGQTPVLPPWLTKLPGGEFVASLRGEMIRTCCLISQQRFALFSRKLARLADRNSRVDQALEESVLCLALL